MPEVPVAAGERSDTRLSARFGANDKVALDETIRKAERLSRVEFSVFVGHAEGDPRAYAVSLHGTLVAPARSILILVDPDARALEVVTGSHVRRTLRDPQVELAVAQMQSLVRRRRPRRRAAPRHPDARRARPRAGDPAQLRALMQILAGALALVVVICVCLLLFFRSLADERARAAEAEVRRLKALLEDVKEVAWTNRDIAPELATIVIDTIRVGRAQPPRPSCRTKAPSGAPPPSQDARRQSGHHGQRRGAPLTRPDPAATGAGAGRGAVLPAVRAAVDGLHRPRPGRAALQGRGVHLEEVRELHRPVDPGLRRSG